MVTYIRGTETRYVQIWAVSDIGSRVVRQLADRHEDERRTNGTRSRIFAVFIWLRIRWSDGMFWTQSSAFQLHE